MASRKWINVHCSQQKWEYLQPKWNVSPEKDEPKLQIILCSVKKKVKLGSECIRWRSHQRSLVQLPAGGGLVLVRVWVEVLSTSGKLQIKSSKLFWRQKSCLAKGPLQFYCLSIGLMEICPTPLCMFMLPKCSMYLQHDHWADTSINATGCTLL